MEQSPRNRKKPQWSDYARYSSLTIRIAAPIALGLWGGIELDKYMHLKFPVFTLSLSLLSVVLAVYWAIKDILKKK